MGLSDCIKCWDTPCTCGWEWRHVPKNYRIEQAALILGISVGQVRGALDAEIPDQHPKWSGEDDFRRKIGESE